MKTIKVGIDPKDLIDGPADGSVSNAIKQLPKHLQERHDWNDHYNSYLVLEPKPRPGDDEVEEWENTHKEIKRGEKRWVRGEAGNRQIFTAIRNHRPKAYHKESECNEYECCHEHCPEWLSEHYWRKGSWTEAEIAEYMGEKS